MPFDDELDDFAPPMAVARAAPAPVGSKAQPINMVILNEGRDPFQSPADVSRDMKIDMRDILHIPKSIHYQGTTAYPTANLREIEQLVGACSSINDENWNTGDHHDLPDIKMIDGGVDSVLLAMSTLLASLGAVTKVKGHDKAARKKIIHRTVNRGETPMKVLKKERTQTPSEHRVSGARVLLALEPGSFKSANFKFTMALTESSPTPSSRATCCHSNALWEPSSPAPQGLLNSLFFAQRDSAHVT